MFKKCISIVLAFLMFCSVSTTIFAGSKNSFVTDNNAEFNDNEEYVVDNEISFTSRMDVDDGKIVLDSDYVLTGTVNSDYLAWLLYTPDEILSDSTSELLDYFLKTPFMGQQVVTCSSTLVSNGVDLSIHEAFRELISRDDCIDALEDYAERILDGSSVEELYKVKFKKLLGDVHIRSIVYDLRHNASDYPNLQSIYSSFETPVSSIGDYVGTINDINYYSAGTINTANNNSVEVCTPHRELTPAEIVSFNNDCGFVGNIRISEPTAVYNCHSYAWYRFSSSNPYWIMDISQFLYDSACTPILPTSAQTKDIIVYFDSNGYPLHSGVVYSVSPLGELTICSKWGQAGVYIHSIGNVPLEYCSNPYTGVITCVIFSYHDYVNQYTGNNYHAGVRHFYEYADICEVCNKQINETWTRTICSGPPCPVFRTK